MPITIGTNRVNSYRIESISISNQEGNTYEVSNLMQSFTINESIYDMFLTGSIVLLDGANLYNRIGFTGQEYIRIHIGGIQGNEQIVPEDQRINQVFRIFNVSSKYQDIENPKLQFYRLEFCSPLLYEARTQRISQAYRNNTSNLIGNICKEYLGFLDNKSVPEGRVKGGKELGNFFTEFRTNVGNQSRLVVPNWTVYKTLEWLRDHTCDPNDETFGDSFYFYQTATEGFKFHSVSNMGNRQYLKGRVSFAPRMSDGNESFNYDFEEGTGHDILAYGKDDLHNIIESHQQGLYSGSITLYDTKSKAYQTIESNFSQQFKLNNDGEYKGNPKLFAKAPNFRLGDENIKIPADGGNVGEDMPQAVDALKRPDIQRRHGAVYFDYKNPFAFSGGREGIGPESYGTSTLSKFNRTRVEQLFKNNRMNIQIAGRTNIACGMTILVDLKQGYTTMTKDEMTHNNEMLVEGITWIGTEDGLETQLTITSTGHEVPMDSFIDHELAPEH